MLCREYCIDAEKTVVPPVANGSRGAPVYRGTRFIVEMDVDVVVEMVIIAVVVVQVGIVGKGKVPVVNEIVMDVAIKEQK